MNNSNYILDSLKNLDNYSTNIETLANDICNKICKEYNIQKTDDLENNIKIILTNYRYGLVDNNMVVAKIDDVIKSAVSSTLSTEKITPIDNNRQESKVNKTSEANKTIDNNQQATEVNKPTKKSNNNIKNQQTINTTLNNQKTNNNTQNNQQVSNINANTTNVTNTSNDSIVDIIPDAVLNSANTYGKVESAIATANIKIPGPIAKYATDVANAAKTGIEEIRNTLNDMLVSITDLVNTIVLLDDSISLDESNKDKIDLIKSEIKETLNFYYHYQGNVKEVKEMSKKTLSTFFERNGAKRNGDVYTFTLNGKEYSYNISTYQMSVEPDDKTKEKENMFARFYMRDDATYEDITNTITILAGQGALDSNSGPFVEGKERLDEGVNAQKSSLIIIPYGHGDGTQGSKSSNKAAMATRIGNFMVGGTNRQITNSIVGYSLGGNAAYEALAQEENKGLYKVCVPVNTFMDKYFGKTEGDSINNMIGTKIIQLEARSDKFRTGSRNARKKLLKGGFPVEDLVLYTNENDEYKYSEKVLGDNYIYLGDINKKITIDGKSQINPNYDPAWVTHFHGIEMIKTSGILTYLGEF